MCSHAVVAGVLIALSEQERDRHATLYDSTRLAHAVDYLFALGERLYGHPVPTVINISLGTNGHAHDGTSAISQWIDRALMTPGRCVCVAAGNAGQEAPQFAGDLGFLTGRIHASGRIPARGLETDLRMASRRQRNRRRFGKRDGNLVRSGGRVRRAPAIAIGHLDRTGGAGHLRRKPAASRARHSCRSTTSATTRRTARTASRFFSARASRIASSASRRARGSCGCAASRSADGRFDAWIERDDPRPLGRIGEVDAWRFPSYFSPRSNVDRSSVSSLACGHRVISVGNCEDAAERIHRSSSQGPTRDGRYKPEIAAPGTDIVAARGFSPPDRPWVAMTRNQHGQPVRRRRRGA